MTWPSPRAGLVVRYSYLWTSEFDAGLEEGVKDRPCAVVLVAQNSFVTVLPITHAPPLDPWNAVEIPLATKRRLGLDDTASWIVATEANTFNWPGPDLRLVPGRGPKKASYGLLPESLVEKARDYFIGHLEAGTARVIKRLE